MSNAPVPVPRTFGVNEFETAAYLDSIRDALNYLLNPPIASLYQATTQSVANNTFSALTMDQTINDSYGGHSNTVNPSRYVAQVAGWYTVSGAAGWATNNTGARGAAIYTNGSPINGGSGVAAPSPGASVTITAVGAIEVFLSTGGYVEIYGYQNSGGALSTQTGGSLTSYFTVDWRHA